MTKHFEQLKDILIKEFKSTRQSKYEVIFIKDGVEVSEEEFNSEEF